MKNLFIFSLFALIYLGCSSPTENEQQKLRGIFTKNNGQESLLRLNTKNVTENVGFTDSLRDRKISGIVESGIYKIYYKGKIIFSVPGSQRTFFAGGNYASTGDHIIFVRDYMTPHVFINGQEVKLPPNFQGDCRLLEEDGAIIIGNLSIDPWSYLVFTVKNPSVKIY